MLDSQISINPEIRFGKPCIVGTRITVFEILEALANGHNFSEIIESFPELDEDKIKAAIRYAANRESVSKVLISA